MALHLTLVTPSPPYQTGLHMIASDGFSNKSAYNQDFTELLIAVMSEILKSTVPHLNQTFDRA